MRRPVLYGDLRRWALLHADSLELLARFPTECVDALVTDPPYGIAFNGEAWDAGQLATPAGFQEFSRTWARQARRVLKPGGYLLSFGSPRTFHRLAAGLEDSGLEIRDLLLWLHGAGMPKSPRYADGTAAALKPAYEPVLLARAPLAAPSVTANKDLHGTGALNVDACRVPRPGSDVGYWPSQIILSHQDACNGSACATGCAVRALDTQAPRGRKRRVVSRLFYAAKASAGEREAGLDGLSRSASPVFGGKALKRPRANVHPTVKPVDLMRWLVRLVTPPEGLVLDPFAGSASTGVAAVLEGRRFIGIERDARYVPLARARLQHWTKTAQESGVKLSIKGSHCERESA